ncbi:PIG-L deacetylase family protein [Streptomyces capitiformicae]|uniref:GlcNAc-PI de-N-acetylase n=1 Tax=Streptomyces capitiformicae TaxID=2014920 RepID=A0A919GHX0_9ACTN|nr:PIG-L family deacetylase [Streptomyces capitiformicae]GHH84741.1 GlcNAc-PI de-N-acetylase [Streptomyces capitiformicae]
MMISPLLARSALFVSPHWDDAVLSAGGLLAGRADADLANTLLTVFAKVPEPPFSEFARSFHRACGLGDDEVQVRVTEDRAAATVLRARLVHGDILDAIYRREARGNWLYDGEGKTFAPRAAEDDVMSDVRALVAKTVRETSPDLILAPRAIGDHVDHVLVREAAVSVGHEQGIPVLQWEDQPYALRQHRILAPGGVDVAIGETAWSRRIAATEAYASQLRMLFRPEEDWAEELGRYARSLSPADQKVERYWSAEAGACGSAPVPDDPSVQ